MTAPPGLNAQEARLYLALAEACKDGPAPAVRVAQRLGNTKAIDKNSVHRLADRLHNLAKRGIISTVPAAKGLVTRWELLPGREGVR
jgi:hypothetical protein